MPHPFDRPLNRTEAELWTLIPALIIGGMIKPGSFDALAHRDWLVIDRFEQKLERQLSVLESKCRQFQVQNNA